MIDRRLLVVILIAAAALPATAAAAAKTRVVRVSPLTSSGQVRAGLRVVTTKPGTCQPFSETVAGAFRCFSDSNFVLDPCWKAGAHTVICMPNPWAHTVTRMHVRGRLGKPSTTFPNLPWALKLRDGEHCLALQGATSVVGGKRVSYGCGRRGSLAGSPNRHHSVWRIRRVRTVGGRFKLGGFASIATAYFGRA
jgi:hypothetical protein